MLHSQPNGRSEHDLLEGSITSAMGLTVDPFGELTTIIAALKGVAQSITSKGTIAPMDEDIIRKAFLPAMNEEAEASTAGHLPQPSEHHTHEANASTLLSVAKPARSVGRKAQVSFADQQLQVDIHAKQLITEWVATHFILTDGAGIFLDAGSSCLWMWRAICQRLRRREFTNITVCTNSFMVLADWAQLEWDPKVRGTVVQMCGEVFDAPHRAFYGQDIRAKLMSGTFRPAAVYIGTNGVEFDETSFLFGHHAEPEQEVKTSFFQCPAKKRVILATAAKLGNAGGRVFDVLSLKDLDTKAPIYLVSNDPKPGSEEERQFNHAMEMFKKATLQTVIKRRGLEFHWIVVDRNSSLSNPIEKEHLIVCDR